MSETFDSLDLQIEAARLVMLVASRICQNSLDISRFVLTSLVCSSNLLTQGGSRHAVHCGNNQDWP